MEDLSKLSSKELEALLEKKRAEERQQALDKRAAYEGIRAELVQKVEQKVRAVAQDNGPGGQLPGAAEQQDELLAVLRKGHAAGRAADAE